MVVRASPLLYHLHQTLFSVDSCQLLDPHTPYSTPESFGNPFADEPVAEWLTEEVRQSAWDGYGPHSAREVHGWGDEKVHERFPRLPEQLDSMASVKRWIDGYDTGIRYADDAVGQLIAALQSAVFTRKPRSLLVQITVKIKVSSMSGATIKPPIRSRAMYH